jgi:hypothetical protein
LVLAPSTFALSISLASFKSFSFDPNENNLFNPPPPDDDGLLADLLCSSSNKESTTFFCSFLDGALSFLSLSNDFLVIELLDLTLLTLRLGDTDRFRVLELDLSLSRVDDDLLPPSPGAKILLAGLLDLDLLSSFTRICCSVSR